MLQWDIKKKTTRGKGILGTVVAFSAANEEQGRKTLHCQYTTEYIWQDDSRKGTEMCQGTIFWQPRTKSLIPSLNKRSGKKKLMRQTFYKWVYIQGEWI